MSFAARCLILLSVAFVWPASAEEPIVQLAKAIEESDLATVEKLLADGVDPNTRIPGSQLNYTPLFLAVQQKDPKITETLLKAGADASIEDENGAPVMVHAAHNDRRAHAGLLIKHGISIDARDSDGETALMRGARYDKAPDSQMKIDLGADPDLANKRGETPLMIAADAANYHAVKILIEAGAKLDIRDPAGKSALMLAVASESGDYPDRSVTGTLELLIKAGADLNLRDQEGNSALMLGLDNWSAKPESLEPLLAAGPDVSFRDQDGRDALHHAVWDKDMNVHIARLIELGGDIRKTDHQGNDLLMVAALKTNPALVRDFLGQGLSPKRRNRSGETAVHQALRAYRPGGDPFSGKEDATAHDEDLVEILKLLHDHGASLTTLDEEGMTPLHLAAISDSSPAFAFLLPFYPDVDLPNSNGNTPLHFAADGGDSKIVELLLPKVPSVDVRNAEGHTPLMLASASNQTDAVLQLLQAGADIEAKDREGRSALDIAVGEEQLGQIRFLMDHGADPKGIAAPASKLHLAVRRFHDQAVTDEDYTTLVVLLAGLVEDIDATDAGGMTALMWAAASNVQPALAAVLARSPDLNARSPDGRTALMWAAASRATESMQALREAGADDTLRDKSGRTAGDWLAWSNAESTAEVVELAEGDGSLLKSVLRSRRKSLDDYLARGGWDAKDRVAGTAPLHLAASLGDTAAIVELLDRGAPVNQRIEDGRTPLIEAAASGRTEALKLLLDRGAAADSRDDNKDRAIDQAIHYGHPDLARVLLGRDHPLSNDETKLLVAVIRRGDEALLRELLHAGASIPPPAVKPDIDCCDQDSKPDPAAPLSAAAGRKNPAILRILVEFPDASGASDPRHLVTALHRAAEAGRLANVKALVEELQVDPDALDAESFGGVIRINGDNETGAVEKYSALSRALEEGHHDVVRYLVGRKVAITGRTRGGEPPLTFAVIHRQPEMLELFLDHGADTELVDFNGETALHHAAGGNDSDAVKILLSKGANPDAKSKKGLTPLDLAREKKAVATIRLLESPAK